MSHVLFAMQWMAQLSPSFSNNVSLANIITWFLIAAAWYASYVKQSQIFRDRLDVVQKWIDAHEQEAADRDQAIRLLELSNTKLVTLVDRADEHFTALEQMANLLIRNKLKIKEEWKG
jgi:hypothetical protein